MFRFDYMFISFTQIDFLTRMHLIWGSGFLVSLIELRDAMQQLIALYHCQRYEAPYWWINWSCFLARGNDDSCVPFSKYKSQFFHLKKKNLFCPWMALTSWSHIYFIWALHGFLARSFSLSLEKTRIAEGGKGFFLLSWTRNICFIRSLPRPKLIQIFFFLFLLFLQIL